jgi:hypothetical protein
MTVTRAVREHRPWGVRGLKERCTRLKASLLKSRSATEQEVAAYWPGGAENTETGLGAWVLCYGQLMRFWGRTDPDRHSARLDAALARQLGREPVQVRCESGRLLTIHPKSYHALRWLEALDRVTLLTQTSREWALDSDDAKAAAMLAPVAESLAVRLWVWALTTDGPGVPFPDTGEAPDPPEWIASLTIHDLLAIAQAHFRVNMEDLAVIAKAFPAEPDAPSRLSLTGFLGVAAEDAGVPASELMRRWTLGELFAQKITAAERAREVREASEAKGRGAR